MHQHGDEFRLQLACTSSSRTSLRHLAVGAGILLCTIFLLFIIIVEGNEGLQIFTNLYSTKSPKKNAKLFPFTVLERAQISRNTELTRARKALEFWWAQRQVEARKVKEKFHSGVGDGACPLSTSAEPRPELISQNRYEYFVKQGLSIMQSMGFHNLTTCNGFYPVIDDCRLSSTRKRKNYRSKDEKCDKGVSAESLFQVGPGSTKADNLSERRQIEDGDEIAIKKKFCYSPVFRPTMLVNNKLKDITKQRLFESKELNISHQNVTISTMKNLNKSIDAFTENIQSSDPHRIAQDTTFCPCLMNLYRAIVSGREPPLLTLFTWIPDVFDDPANAVRHSMLLNLDSFRPFIQPVLVSDRRMVMAIANRLNWPCLPVHQLSPDGFPIFEPAAKAVLKAINSTFHGYLRRVSYLDASLLETLLAVKDAFMERAGEESVTESTQGVDEKISKQANREEGYMSNITKNTMKSHLQNGTENDIRSGVFIGPGVRSEKDFPEKPKVIIYGSSLYTDSMRKVGKFLGSIGEIARTRAEKVPPNDERAYMYILYSGIDFSGVPPLKVDDQFLIPLLVSRSQSLDHLVIDASETILSLHVTSAKRLSEWKREYPLQKTPRNDTYNRVLYQNYFNSLGYQITDWKTTILKSKFTEKGGINFVKDRI